MSAARFDARYGWQYLNHANEWHSCPWVRYVTPDRLRTEIISFDRGHRFEPGDYHLVPLQPSQRRGRKGNPAQNGGTVPQRGRRTNPAVVNGVRYSASPSVYA